MKVTKQNIMDQFGVMANAVRQIGSKQLFIVDNHNSTKYMYAKCRILVSYKTIIGIFDADCVWHITDKKYSATTSKQTSQFINQTPFACFRCADDELQAMLRQQV